MSFGQAVATCFANYATFAGRARRAEYWHFVLFGLLMQIATGILDAQLLGFTTETGGPLQALFLLATVLPSLSVFVRRLHDTGRSGWWFWLLLVPLVGWIVVLLFLVTPGTPGRNAYGPDPLAPAPPADPPGLSVSRMPRVPRR